MKIATIVVRILMGAMFVFFGSNSFFHFLPTPPMPPTPAGQFLTALIASHYVMVIGGAQVLGGLLVLINRYVPVGLAILGPVIVNILAYHLLMSTQGIGGAIVVTILWFFLFYAYREYFAPLFTLRAQPR